MTAEAPEIEALRLMTETNAGHSSLLVGQWMLFSSLILMAIGLIIYAAKGEGGLKPMIVLGSIALGIGLMSWISLLFSSRRLSRALTSAEQEKNLSPGHRQPPLTARINTDPLRLPAVPSAVSVTEGTTELMEEQESIPARRRVKEGQTK
jgi:hypothetical protein